MKEKSAKRILFPVISICLSASMIIAAYAGQTQLPKAYEIVYTEVSSGDEASTYAITGKDTENGKLTLSTNYASADETVTITTAPDKGWTLETLTVKDANGEDVELTADSIGESYTFIMPAGEVTVEATFMEDNSMLNFFADVTAADHYYDAVLWAAENGIASGADAVHFAPLDITTRAQMITFLWRSAGSPEPTSAVCKFTDVDTDAYYYKAVLWAMEKGIASGMTETEFAPKDPVTRAQAVTFLWRYEGAIPFANMTAYGPAPSPFSDASTDAYYYNAILWAKTQGITSGTTETTFSPNDSCTRAQIVTFLYRTMVK